MHTAILSIVAVAAAVLPGLLVGRVTRLPWHLAVCFALPATYGMVALGSWITGAAGIPWNVWSALGTIVVFAALAGVYRLMAVRRERQESGRPGGAVQSAPAGVSETAGRRPHCAALAAAATGVLFGIGTIYGVLIYSLTRARNGVHNVPSGWDELWHTNVLQFIGDTGIASPTQLGRLRNVETHEAIYYPDAWHALGSLPMQITGSTPLEVFNIWSIVSVALVLPLSVAALAWRLVRDRMDATPAALAAGCAGAITGLFPALPYPEMSVGAVPSAVGVGMAGLVAVLVMSVPGARTRIPLAAIGLIGLWSLHPSGAVFAIALIAAWWLFHLLTNPRRSRVSDLGSLAAVGVVAALLLVPQISGVLGETGEIGSYSFFGETHSRATAFMQAIAQQTWMLDGFGLRVVLLGAAVVGAIALLIRRSWWWLPAWAVLVVLTTNAVLPFRKPFGDWMFKITGTFYNDPRRLSYAIAFLVAAVAGIGIAAVLWGCYRMVQKRTSVPDRVRAGALAGGFGLVLIIAGWHAHWMADTMEPAVNAHRDNRMISDGDREAFDFLANLPDARTTTIYNDPDQGTGWIYALNGLHPMYTHYAFPTDVGANAWTVWDGLRRAGDDPVVDGALRNLNVRYIIMSDPTFWPFQSVPPGMTGLDTSPGLTRVFDNGSAQIYEVDAWRPPAPHQLFVGWDPGADR
ncbi:MAG: hypothetical protein L0H59_04615 [Tomitella sp.]|nr:hypothetical protein [Tomitella sp.]